MNKSEFLEQFSDAVTLSQTKCTQPIQADLKYCTRENFVGRVVNGYEPTTTVQGAGLLGNEAAHALCQAQNDLIKNGLGIVIVDSYRPRCAVLDFMAWSKEPAIDDFELERKAIHFPEITKPQLFELGYLDYDSSHCYGNTVDLMLIDIVTEKWIDMGAPFDYMGSRSHLDATVEMIGEAPYQIREILQTIMQAHDFESYTQEFWHFSHMGKAGRLKDKPIEIPLTRDLIESIKVS